MEAQKKTLFVCWWRRDKWEAKPFTGNESWQTVLETEESYNETCVLVAADDAATAAKIAESRPELTFPEILVG